VKGAFAAPQGAIRASRENPKGRNRPSFDPCFRHFAVRLPPSSRKSGPVVGSPIDDGDDPKIQK